MVSSREIGPNVERLILKIVDSAFFPGRGDPTKDFREFADIAFRAIDGIRESPGKMEDDSTESIAGIILDEYDKQSKLG